MLGQIWLKFKKDGFCGSVSVKTPSGIAINSDLNYEDKPIHEAVHDMDGEYKYVKVFHEGYTGPQDIPTVILGDDPATNKEVLDNAILDGLAHQRIFREANTGAVVQFGYDLNEA
jgi:hypothetical protein